MNDRPEFLDRLKEDLRAGAPGFRSRQRRRRVAVAAVAGVAAFGGLGAFVAFGDDGEPTESVSAVAETSEAEEESPAAPIREIESLTATARDLTDTAVDVADGGTLAALGIAPSGVVEACPLGAPRQISTGDIWFEREEWTENDDVVAFVLEHIRDTYPNDAPIRTSAVYEPSEPGPDRSTRTVLAPWPGEDQTQIGAWFSVTKTSAGLGITQNSGCAPFLWGTTPWGAPMACPGGAEEGFVADLVGSPEGIGPEDFDDVTAFVQAYIAAEYPPDAPISSSRIFVVASPRPPGPAPLFVAAPWSPNSDEPIGMWFKVGKTEAGFAVASGDGCADFVAAVEATTLSSSELDALLTGVRVGLVDYNVGQTPAELRTFVDIALRGSVVAVHEGRTLRSLLEPSGLNDEPFATLEIQGEEFASSGAVGRESTFYVEIQMGDLRGDQLQVLVGTEVIAFGIDTSDVDVGEQWAIDNPLGGRPDASQLIFTVYPQGLLLVTEQSVVGVYDELPVGWSPVQNFATGTEAADWVVAEAEK